MLDDLNPAIQTLMDAGRNVANAKNELKLAEERETIDKIDGVTYIRKNGRLTRPDNYPQTLSFAGLDAILSYRGYIARHFGEPDMLYVVEDKRVGLMCAHRYGITVENPIFATATPPNNNPPLGRFMPMEEFMLMLKTCFVADRARADLIAIIGNVKYEAGLSVADDGISQEAHAKVGVHFVEKAKVPADLMLTRFESFPEIQEKIPARPYFLRLKIDGDEKKPNPVAALFGVADPAADLRIRHLVKDYLVDRLVNVDGMDPERAADVVLV